MKTLYYRGVFVLSQNKSSFVVDGNIKGFYITRNVEVTHGKGGAQRVEFRHYKSTLWIKTNIKSAPIIEKDNMDGPLNASQQAEPYDSSKYPF